MTDHDPKLRPRGWFRWNLFAALAGCVCLVAFAPFLDQCGHSHGHSLSARAQNQMSELEKAIELYRWMTDALPATLSALTESTQAGDRGLMPHIDPDPWMEDFVYRRDGDGFVLLSKGPDREAGTEDDILLEPLLPEQGE